MQSFISTSVEQTHKIAAQLIKNNKVNLICLYGELGSGKTTFVQGLGEILGVKNRIISPTFVIVREYDIAASNQKPVNWKLEAGNWRQLIHIDCYRLDSAKDTKSFNFEEYWSDPKNLVVIEWAERIRNVLPKKKD